MIPEDTIAFTKIKAVCRVSRCIAIEYGHGACKSFTLFFNPCEHFFANPLIAQGFIDHYIINIYIFATPEAIPYPKPCYSY